MRSVEITYNIDDDDDGNNNNNRGNDKYNVGDLDQIVEDDEEDKEETTQSLKAAIQNSLAVASQMN